VKFPNVEKYGLVSQINRAAVSVSSNLAEGSSRASLKDQAHFSQLAYSSLMEVACQLILATDLGYITDNDRKDLGAQFSELSNKINALRNSQLVRARSR
jgi:four helix bundle protein